MAYDNTNRGSIWPNKRKETDSHPDFTGTLNIDGKEFWVNAWKRKPEASPESPSLSFSVRPKDQSSQPSRGVKPVAATDPRRGGMDDEIPY